MCTGSHSGGTYVQGGARLPQRHAPTRTGAGYRAKGNGPCVQRRDGGDRGLLSETRAAKKQGGHEAYRVGTELLGVKTLASASTSAQPHTHTHTHATRTDHDMQAPLSSGAGAGASGPSVNNPSISGCLASPPEASPFHSLAGTLLPETPARCQHPDGHGSAHSQAGARRAEAVVPTCRDSSYREPWRLSLSLSLTTTGLGISRASPEPTSTSPSRPPSSPP